MAVHSSLSREQQDFEASFPSRVLVTTIYLTQSTHEALASPPLLPARAFISFSMEQWMHPPEPAPEPEVLCTRSPVIEDTVSTFVCLNKTEAN